MEARTSDASAHRGRLYGLQYLRAIAAAGVVIFHSGRRYDLFIHQGEAGVDLFFVLSGFLMVTISTAATRPQKFMLDRLIRVVPPYWIATSAMIAGGLLHIFPNLHLTAPFVIASYLFVPLRSPSGEVWPVMVQGWTLNLEMGFYLIYSGALFLPRRLQVPALAIFLVGLVAYGQTASEPSTAVGFWSQPIVLEFAAGAMLGLAWRHTTAWSAQMGVALLALGAASAVFLPPSHLPRVLAYGTPAFLILYGVLHLERTRLTIAGIEWLTRLGDASYSTYLWHTFGISICFALANRLHLPRAAGMTLCVIGGHVAGLIAYRVIERPLQRLFHRRRYRHGAPVPAGV
jgi:exopolysaccharide production protein ExoZ